MRGASSIGSYLMLIITVDMYANKKFLHHTCCLFLEKYVRVHSPSPFSIAVIVFSSYAVGFEEGDDAPTNEQPFELPMSDVTCTNKCINMSRVKTFTP